MSVDDAARASYERARDRRGEQVIFRRIAGDAPNVLTINKTVTAIVMHDSPAGPIGGFAGDNAITREQRTLIVLEGDLAKEGFPLPLRKNDTVLVQGVQAEVQRVDPSSRGIAGALDVVVSGVA